MMLFTTVTMNVCLKGERTICLGEFSKIMVGSRRDKMNLHLSTRHAHQVLLRWQTYKSHASGCHHTVQRSQ